MIHIYELITYFHSHTQKKNIYDQKAPLNNTPPLLSFSFPTFATETKRNSLFVIYLMCIFVLNLNLCSHFEKLGEDFNSCQND